MYPIEFVTRSSRSGFMSFVGIKVQLEWLFTPCGSCWEQKLSFDVVMEDIGRQFIYPGAQCRTAEAAIGYGWQLKMDRYCLDLMEQKGGRLGSCRMSFLFDRKWAAMGTSITVSNSIGFLTTNKGKQTMCSMHTQPSVPPSDTDEQTRIIDIHHLGL